MSREFAIWLLFGVVIIGTALSNFKLTLLAILLMLWYIHAKRKNLKNVTPTVAPKVVKKKKSSKKKKKR